MIPIFDTHTHDAFEAFDEDLTEMIARGEEAGVQGKIQIGCDEDSSRSALTLAIKYEKMWASVGLHPCHVEETFQMSDVTFAEDFLLAHPQKIVAIGETGFDFFHNDSPNLRKTQEEAFLCQIHLAKKHNKAIVIHTRNAREETIDFLQTHQNELPERGVFHCFCEEITFARFATEELGYFLGIGGTATYKKNDHIREAIRSTPIEFLVTETDAPYLAPQENRGKRNESAYLLEVVTLIADIKNIPLQKCAETLFENAKRLFSL